MKRCTKCKKNKDIVDFNFKSKLLGVYSSECKDCTRLLVRNHYNKNRQYYLEKTKRRNDLLRQTTLVYISEYLSKNYCVDCGESDITVLEFDHDSKYNKIESVSHLIKYRYSLNKVIEEIAKCQVRCANCHRRKTARDFNWVKSNKHS